MKYAFIEFNNEDDCPFYYSEWGSCQYKNFGGLKTCGLLHNLYDEPRVCYFEQEKENEKIKEYYEEKLQVDCGNAICDSIMEFLEKEPIHPITHLINNILLIDGVEDVRVIKNYNDESKCGFKPLSLKVYVKGGDSKKICEVIYHCKPGGIALEGEIYEEFETSGHYGAARFSRDFNEFYKFVPKDFKKNIWSL